MNLNDFFGISGAGHLSKMIQMKRFPALMMHLELKNRIVKDLGAITILKWN